jgi:signal transduction histidine kinase
MRHDPRFPPRFKPRRGRGLFLFLWFVFLFGLMGVLVIGGLAFAAYLIRVDSSMMMHPRDPGGLLAPVLCLMAPVLFLALAGWSRKRISNPLAGILEAAEAITAGDLSARVPENARGPFRTVEQAFNRMIAELERSDQQRRDLTADIAHDLNTPIHIIRGYLEGIADGIYPADEETINLLLDETNLMSRLVEDLRTLTLADSGELPLYPEEVLLAEFLGDIQTSFSGQAEAAGISLLVDAVPGLTLFADPDRLDQIVSNLVANSMRNTPAGGQIMLQAAQDQEMIVLTVEDTGAGIAPEDLPNIFNRFWRKDKSRDRKDGGGHGLGLAIVKQLVAAHGGSVEVASNLGEGTRFMLCFPSNQ